MTTTAASRALARDLLLNETFVRFEITARQLERSRACARRTAIG